MLLPSWHLPSQFPFHHQSFSPAPTPFPFRPQNNLQAHLSPSCEPLQWWVSSLDIWDGLALNKVDQGEEDRSRYLHTPAAVLCPAHQLLAQTLPRLKATTSVSRSSSSPCSNLFPRAGCTLDRLPGTAGSLCQNPASLVPGMQGGGRGGQEAGFGFWALQAAVLPRRRRCRCRSPPSFHLLSSLVTRDTTTWQTPSECPSFSLPGLPTAG